MYILRIVKQYKNMYIYIYTYNRRLYVHNDNGGASLFMYIYLQTFTAQFNVLMISMIEP